MVAETTRGRWSGAGIDAENCSEAGWEGGNHILVTGVNPGLWTGVQRGLRGQGLAVALKTPPALPGKEGTGHSAHGGPAPDLAEAGAQVLQLQRWAAWGQRGAQGGKAGEAGDTGERLGRGSPWPTL